VGRVISFINYKGGVGKTTTTYHVGCSLAFHHGKKILMVDIDPQTNLTFLCVAYDSWLKFKRNNGTIATLYHRFQEKLPLQTKRYIWQSAVGQGQFRKIPNIDLLPCDLELLGEDLGGVSPILPVPSPANPFQVLQKQAKQTLREWLFLKEALSEVQDNFDYILIDCPPNIYMMTQNALVASDWYVVTTIPEYLSTIGLQILVRKVSEIRKKVVDVANLAGINDVKVAELGGVIFVKLRVGGTIITQQHYGQMAQIQQDFPQYCFESQTTELIGYSEAAERRLPVWLADTTNARRAAAKMEYENITTEFLRRF
jgi:chromosome partitioning protein